MESAVSIKDVKKSFDGKDFVLKGLSLEVPKGSLTAIIGFSGTGKSVLLKHMLGLFQPTSGKIEVLGTDMSTLNPDQLTKFRCHFGVLFQSAALFDDMTVLENVCFPLIEHRRDLKPNQVQSIAEEKLKLVGLDTKHFAKLPSQISGGMQKRTGLARALALDPEILVYDEPTTGLDPILTEMVDNLILDTHKHKEGTTSIMVSHDLYAAFRIADYVAMLDAGQVLLYGKPEDFYKSDIELVKKFVAKGDEAPMSFLGTTEFKVGALVIAVGSLIGFMSMQVTDDPGFLGGSKKAWFLLDNAAGLIKNSGVKTAGIPIGVIKDIRLQDGKARVEITIKSDIPVTTSASVEIKSIGILGDKHVEVNPGSLSDPPLPDGGQILIVKDKGSLDNVLAQVGDIAGSLKEVAEVVRESLSDDGNQKHVLGRIVKNIEQVTADIKEITGENKEQIGEIVDQVNDITRTLDEMINDETDEGLKKVWKKTLARLDSTMKNIDEISTKINKGEGTIGKLINDETTVEELNTAIGGLSSLFDTAGKIQTGFDYHGHYLTSIGQTKSHIGIQIQPGLDRYYYLAIVDDPAGVVDRESSTVTSGGAVISDTQTVKRFQNKTKFTALFAKNFYDFTIKGGLIENSGGIGFDYHLLNRKLRFSVEAFNFEKMNLRASARYDLFYGLYLMAGQQDIFDKDSLRSSYLGAGLFLTNDDLKLLLTSSPF